MKSSEGTTVAEADDAWHHLRSWLAGIGAIFATALSVSADNSVAFDPPGGLFLSPVRVRLAADSSSAMIRYTVDGSEPTTNSTAYTGPLRLERTTLIKARLFPQQGPPGAGAVETYVFLGPDLTNFTSNLPLVMLETFGSELTKETKTLVSARFCAGTDAGARVSLQGEPQFAGRVTVNLRGQSSLRYPKKSFTLKLRDDSGESRKIPLFGLPKSADWVLYAPYPDKTLLRDVLAYELSNQMGRYAPRGRFVELFINPGAPKLSREHYLGVYVLLEKIERDKHRVNLAGLDASDDREPNISGGYLFKKDHLDGDETGLPDYPAGSDLLEAASQSRRDVTPSPPGAFPADPAGFLPHEPPPTLPATALQKPASLFVSAAASHAAPGWWTRHGHFFFYVEPEADKITSAQRGWLAGYVDRLETALYGPQFRDPTNGYAAFIDADSFIDHHLLVETTKNIDGFRFSTFYHKDRQDRLCLGPLWDWNLAFGNAAGKQGYLPQHWYWPQLDDLQYAWFRRLFEDPDFGQRYVDRWGELRQTVFSVSNLFARVDALTAQLNEAQARNFKRWPILGSTVRPNYFVGQTWQEEIDYLKKWTQTRLEWMNQQFVAAPVIAIAAAATGSAPPRTNAAVSARLLTLSAPAGRVHFTTDGTDPRLPGGSLSPRAQTWSAPTKLPVNARIVARAHVGNRWSHAVRN